MKRVFVLAAACMFVLGATSVQVLAQTQAKAQATVVNGFVVAVTVTDGGSGYGQAPNVTFVGGGGSGATATAILNQGSVSQIVVLTAGSGYTNALAVVVDPPPVITQSQATALASVLNGFVVSVTVTDGGSGYSLVPNVAFTGGGGSGATATAILSNASVARIVVLTAGAGYTNAPTVAIDPPVVQATLSLDMLARVTVQGQVGQSYTVQYTDTLSQTNSWQSLATVTLTNSTQYVIDVSSAGKPNRYYRAIPVAVFNPDSANLVYIQPGTFVMGSPAAEVGHDADESPLTTVTLTDGFFMRKTLVTQQEYLAVMGNNPAYWVGDLRRPVEVVGYGDATNFCQKLTTNAAQAGNLPAGMVYRLPTEAEWEYACRAGTTNRFFFGDDPGYTNLVNYAWCPLNSGGMTHPVATKLPNPWGLYDMGGNVWEWCWGSYTSSLPGGSQTNPVTPVTGANGVLRGGSWFHSPDNCRSAARNYWGYNVPNYSIGFRVVLAKPIPQ